MQAMRKICNFSATLALFGLASPAHSASFIYEVRGTAGGANSIWRIDPLLPNVSVGYPGYPGGNAATLAQCPDGRLYYAINASNGGIYRWDPATPLIAPVLIGNLGGGVPGSFRFACSNAGVLYYMPDTGVLYTVSTANGAATPGPTITGTGSGGDMAVNSAGTLYIINSSKQLYTASVAGGAATALGTVSGIANNNATLGLAFDSAGNLYTETQNPTNLYKITGIAASLVVPLLGGTTATGDLASFILPSGTVGVAKTFLPTTIVVGSVSTLTITVSNANTTAQTALAFSDVYPANLVNAPAPAAATTCGGTVTAIAGGSSLALSGGTIPASGSCTIKVNVTSAVAGAYTNSLPARSVTTAFTYNDVAASANLTVSVPKLPMTFAKTSAAYSDPVNGTTNPKRIPGGFVDYVITAGNSAGGAIDNNAVVITDPVPANTELFVGNLGVAGSGPIAFSDGAPASGLSYTFISLASNTDDVAYSNDGGATFLYSPNANANGVDASVTNLRINPQGSFNSSTQFQIRFRVRVK